MRALDKDGQDAHDLGCRSDAAGSGSTDAAWGMDAAKDKDETSTPTIHRHESSRAMTMDDANTILSRLIGVCVLVGGVYTLVKGEFKIGVEGTDAYDRVVSGRRARWLGLGFIVAGFWFFVSVQVGILATLGLGCLAFMAGKRRD